MKEHSDHEIADISYSNRLIIFTADSSKQCLPIHISQVSLFFRLLIVEKRQFYRAKSQNLALHIFTGEG